jgi:phage FluMu protein Com
MTNNRLLRFFQLQRQIFGVCPHSGKVFRLSDCQIYIKKKPEPDWLQQIELAQSRIDKAVEKLEEKEETIRESARIAGRKEANKIVKNILVSKRTEYKIRRCKTLNLYSNGKEETQISQLQDKCRNGAVARRIN